MPSTRAGSGRSPPTRSAASCPRCPTGSEEPTLPEGHTIHRLARDLRARFGGQPVAASSPQGRFAAGAALVDGDVLARTDAHGKHLFLGFGGSTARSLDARWIHVHLGLYGKFTLGTPPAPLPRGALRLRLVTDQAWADLRGPTACEVQTSAEKAAISARLGPDPLRRDADPERGWARVRRSRTTIGALLMDQAVVSGVGNVFRAEVLFRAGVSPFRAGRELAAEDWEAMWADLSGLLAAAVRANRIVTTAPEHRARRTGRPRREDAHYVYRRTGLPCRVCATPVQTELMVSRKLYWCPGCQPRSGA